MVGGVAICLDQDGAHPVREQDRCIERKRIADEPGQAQKQGRETTDRVTDQSIPPRER